MKKSMASAFPKLTIGLCKMKYNYWTATLVYWTGTAKNCGLVPKIRSRSRGKSFVNATSQVWPMQEDNREPRRTYLCSFYTWRRRRVYRGTTGNTTCKSRNV